jgi:glycosyl transferase family 87
VKAGFVPAAVTAAVLFVVACSITSGGLFSHSRPGDTNRYAQIGRALVHHGQIPYRDFYDEYPPGSVPVFALPVLIWDAHYVLVFKLLMTACGIGLLTCATWILHRLDLTYWRLAPIIAAPPLMGSVFLNRYDPLPAFTCVLALVALLRARERLTGALLGIGTALKIYPALAVVLMARRARRLGRAPAAFVAAVAVLCLPFFVLAPGGVGYSLETQLRRHLQVESLGSSILLSLSKLGIHHVGLVNGKPGSIDIGGSLGNAVGTFSSLLAVALVLLVARAYWRGADEDSRLVTAWAAAVVGFTVFGKVLSPQYLTWLLPLVPLAAGRRGLYAVGTFFVALALTQPERFLGDKGFPEQNWSVWLLLFRNGLLVATFWFLYSSLRPQATLNESGTSPAL